MLMAADFFSEVGEPQFSFETDMALVGENTLGQNQALPKSKSQAFTADETKYPLSYQAGNQSIGVGIDPNKIAIAFNDVGMTDRSSFVPLGLTFVRKLDERVSLYEGEKAGSFESRSRIAALGGSEYTTAVFEIGDQKSEAVLLDEIIVSLDSTVAPESYFASNAQFSSYRPLVGTNDQFIAKVTSGRGVDALLTANKVEGDSRVRWVSPNFYQNWQRYFTPNDPRFGNQWHLNNTGQGGGLVDADSDLPEAWDINAGATASFTIGVVDDGVTFDHPDLNLWTNPGEVAGDSIDNDNNGWVDDIHGWNFVSNNALANNTQASDMHGTSVAGVAAASGNNAIGVTGAAYNAKVFSAKIFEGASVATDANIAAALYYAAGRKASGVGTWKAADIVNNSWGGGGTSTAINAALTWGTTQGREGVGATFLFATGNDYSTVSEPAAQSVNIPGVIAVGATNNFGELSDYSNTGPEVDIVTPSNDTRIGYLAIDTTDRVGAAGYASGDYTGTGGTGFGGTSSATPLATGIATLVLSEASDLNIALSPAELRGLLRNNTDLIDGATYDPATGKNNDFGFGRLNAGSAVSGVGKAEISVLSPTVDLVSGSGTYAVGSVVVGQFNDYVVRVRNQGTSALNLSSLSIGAGAFSIQSGFSDSVLTVGESATFTVRFSPGASGNFSSVVTIGSNDLDESSFTFTISGIGISPSIGGVFFEDWDGDGVRDAQDPGIAGRLVYLDANGNSAFDNGVVSTFSNTTASAINDFATVTSSINVSGTTNFITDVNVKLNITHTYDADLTAYLISPSGVRIQLFDQVGDNGDNFINTVFDDEASVAIAAGASPFSGSFRPAQSLSVLDGVMANGNWQLEITDGYSGDTGTLNSWEISFSLGEQSVVSNASGGYAFVGLPNGSYTARTLVPVGWSASGPAGGAHLFTITSPSDSNTGRDFGSGRNNRFYGQVFNDVDSDGVFDSSESALGNRSIYIDLNGNGLLDLPASSTFTNSVPLSVPDLTTVNSTLAVAGVSGNITDVNVKVNITMTYDADLDVFLVHPDGTRIELFTDVGGNGDNFTNTVLDDSGATLISAGVAPFTGTFRPEGVLANLNTKTANGNWKLELSDDASGDQATLNSWELTIASGESFVMTDSNGAMAIDLAVATSDIRLAPTAAWGYTLPVNGLRTVTPAGVPLFDQRYGSKLLNTPPILGVDNASVTVGEGVDAANTGTWADNDLPANVVTLSASVGTVVKNANGTWSWSIGTTDQQATQTVTITATDDLGASSTTTFTYAVSNLPPVVAASNGAVSGNVLSLITNAGTYGDVAADTVSLSASHGVVVSNGNGTWSWSITPSAAQSNQVVTITATDEDGGASTTTFSLSALVAVTNRRVFYNDSGYESNGGVNTALDGSKTLLRATNIAQQTTFANVSSYSRGINGVILDVAGLVNNSLTNSDFIFRVAPAGAIGNVTPSTWAAAPTPSVINVTPGNATTAARVRLEWLSNQIQNTWLQIIVLANENTGLTNREVYYLGSALGEVDGVSPYRVSTSDVGLVRAGVGNAVVSVDDVRDIDKDRRITTSDVGYIRGRVSNSVLINNITIPAAGSGAEGELVNEEPALANVAPTILPRLGHSEYTVLALQPMASSLEAVRQISVPSTPELLGALGRAGGDPEAATASVLPALEIPAGETTNEPNSSDPARGLAAGLDQFFSALGRDRRLL